MVFTGYLTNQQIQSLVLAAVSGDLLGSRAALLTGLPPAYAASLPLFNNQLDQFQSDLTRVSLVERLADGQVPLVTVLQNAAFALRLRGKPEASAYQEVSTNVGNLAMGVPPLPAPAGLSEIVSNEQIVGDPDFIAIDFLAAGVEVARAVALITLPRFENGGQVMLGSGGPLITHGTAWLVGPGLVLTNHHVINARRSDEAPASDADRRLQALNATLEFGFDREDATRVTATVSNLLASSASLDYALLGLAGAPDLPVPRLRSALVTIGPTSRMAVNIIQHPGAKPKQVALRNNLVTAADGETIRYFTDTDKGSSGSPVCDDQWRVVALHRGTRYTDKANYQGKSEAYVNFGSQIQAVLADIRAAAPAAAGIIDGAQPAGG